VLDVRIVLEGRHETVRFFPAHVNQEGAFCWYRSSKSKSKVDFNVLDHKGLEILKK
jgi:hypothetical protein